MWPLKPSFDVDLFAGTAWYYAEYRAPYPRELIDDLVRRAEVSGEGLLVDLACGTGEVALALEPYFREVWAIDQEPEMIEVGRQKAARSGAERVRWSVGRAEAVEAPAAPIDLVTVGSAFHRLDRPLIAHRALEWLAPGRRLAILNSNSIWTGTTRWQELAVEVIRRWVGDRPRQGRGQAAAPAARHNEVLEQAGYEDVAEYEFPTPHTWTLDAVVGYVYSTSVASKRVLGEAVDEFEADLRRTLLAHDSSALYPEVMHFDYILGRRPHK
jgi:SAM-dependent methyltransferase